MIKVLMVAAPEQFRDEELLVPREAFLAQGWTVVTASTQTGLGTGMMGAQEAFQVTLADIENPQEFAAIVVVGGFGAVKYLWHDNRLHQLCRDIADQGGVVSAICVSPVVLANAGLLNERQATVYDMPESREAFDAHQVIFTGEPVTVDGRLITANGPEAAAAFAEAVINGVTAGVLVH